MSDILIQAEDIQRTRRGVTGLYARHCRRDYAEFERAIDRDRFMTAEEAVEWGLVDRIVESRAEDVAGGTRIRFAKDGLAPRYSSTMFDLGDKLFFTQRVVMAKKKKKGAKNAKAGSSDPARQELLQHGGGFDWGWPALEMVMANDELTRRLMVGGFSGCGYGVIPDGIPFISLFGDNLAGMKAALALMKEWTTMSGPNAIRIEIAYDGPGYVLAISQQPDLLLWRLSGIDTIRSPLILSMSHIKRMDSRHPNLDQLADYAQQPVAPIWLIVNELPKSLAREGGSRSYAFKPQWDNAILLPGIDIYRQLSDRPTNTMARTEAEFESSAKAGPEGNWPPQPEQNPASVASKRERRLAASLPKTLHVLRNTDRASALLAHGQIMGCANWQVEQAICNLRSAEFLAYQPSSVGKRLAMIEAVRNWVLEPASIEVNLTNITIERLSTQVALDAAYLLRRLEPDREIAEAVDDRIRRVQELGYG